jgi:glycosyltransferase involved in cell wall biosynthesis
MDRKRKGFTLLAAVLPRLRRSGRNVSLRVIGALLSGAEGMGMSGLEFLSLGVPLLATAVGGLKDYVTDDVGVLVPANVSEDNLEACLRLLIDDPRHLKVITDGAFRRRSDYRWSASVRHLRSVLNDGE